MVTSSLPHVTLWVVTHVTLKWLYFIPKNNETKWHVSSATSTSILQCVLYIATCHLYYHIVDDVSCHVIHYEPMGLHHVALWRREKMAHLGLVFSWIPLLTLSAIPDDLTLSHKFTIMQGFGLCGIAMLQDVGSRDCDIAILRDVILQHCDTARLHDCGIAGLRVCGITGLRVCGITGCGVAGCTVHGMRDREYAGLPTSNRR